MSLFFSAHTEKKPDGKEESMDAVTVTAVYIIYLELRKPIDCFTCAWKVVIAKSSPNLFIRKQRFIWSITTTSKNSYCNAYKQGWKRKAFTLIRCVTAFALLFNICRADWRERNSVKKMALSDRREFVIFRNGVNVRMVVGSYRPRSR